MVIDPPEKLPTVFIPICFVCGFSMDVKNKVPSVIWEVGLSCLNSLWSALETEPRPAQTRCESSHHVCQDVSGVHCFVCLIYNALQLESMFPRAMTSSQWNCLLGWRPEWFPAAAGPCIPLSKLTLELGVIYLKASLTSPPFPWWHRPWFSPWSLYSVSRYSLATSGTESARAAEPAAAGGGVLTAHIAHTTAEARRR